MKVAVIRNIPIEGAGTFAAYLEKKGYELHDFNMQGGDRLPHDAEEFSMALLMGGPMNVYEEDKYPFLREELHFLEDCLAAGTKVIGFCLGGQLIARGLGAKVKKNPVKEIGWYDVDLTTEGKESGIMEGLPPSFPVFQWHGDTFDIPVGGTRLAGSELCRNQAFIAGDALALQFHIEVGKTDIGEWCGEYAEELKTERGENGMGAILAETEEKIPETERVSEIFFSNLCRWVRGTRF